MSSVKKTKKPSKNKLFKEVLDSEQEAMDFLEETWPLYTFRFSTPEEDTAGTDIICNETGRKHQVKYQAMADKTKRYSFELAVYNRFERCWQLGNHYADFDYYVMLRDCDIRCFSKGIVDAYIKELLPEIKAPHEFISHVGYLDHDCRLTELSYGTQQKQWAANRAHTNAINLCIPVKRVVASVAASLL